MLKLMYITNQPNIAAIAQETGVDCVFVDMEFIGKDARQKGLDTVKSHHTFSDICNVRKVLTSSELLVRVNPIHRNVAGYPDSAEEIENAISAGADTVMLPYFKSPSEVSEFIECVSGKAKTMLLLETPEAVEALDDILRLPGIDAIHIGLNDLSLGYEKRFMFELLTDGTVESISEKLRNAEIPFGFGGIAAIGKGMLPSEYVIREHYRLGSQITILSRSFCNTAKITDPDVVKEVFSVGVRQIRELEKACVIRKNMPDGERYFASNRKAIGKIVKSIISEYDQLSGVKSR